MKWDAVAEKFRDWGVRRQEAAIGGKGELVCFIREV